MTRIDAGPFTAQIKNPGDWQLTGVDAIRTGGRTGQSFPLHILSDKIPLLSQAGHAGSRYAIRSGSNAELLACARRLVQRTMNFLSLAPFSTALMSPCFGAKLY